MTTMPDHASRRGQSLIEVMVAMTMLTIGFLGAIALLSRSLALNRFTASNVTATYLASEGVEIAKNLIDHDVFAQEFGGQGTGWGSCFGIGGGSFEIDLTTGEPGGWGQCGNLVRWSSAPDPLEYNAATHVYGYQNGGVQTAFTRRIDVSYAPNNVNEVTVVSTVFWQGLDGASEKVALEDHFYNWYSSTSTAP
jgi:prepilin-type N-terminal cleavage/methylation domain-containing protein